MSEATIHFRVYKGSKLLFECEIAQKDALTVALHKYLVRVDEMAILQGVDFAITKRLNVAEVDRMNACSRQQPPQSLVALKKGKKEVPGHRAAFEDLAVYLKNRERAGVGSISPGVLVLLIPLADRNDYMQCQIINTNTTVGEIGAHVSMVAVPPPAAAAKAGGDSGGQHQRRRVPVAATDALEQNDSTSGGRATTAADPEPVASDPRMEENATAASELDRHASDPFFRLRQEHTAFHAFYHNVLQEWSTKPLDGEPARDVVRTVV